MMDLINILDDVIKNIDYIYDIFGYLIDYNQNLDLNRTVFQRQC